MSEIVSDEERRKQEQQDEDAGLTPAEREFKRMHPETWKRMQAEREQQERGRS